MQKFSWICFPASFSSKLVPNKLVNSCFFSINAFRSVSLKFDTVVRFSYLWGNEEIELGEWRIMQSSWLDFSCIKIQIWKGRFKLLISSASVSKLLNKQAKWALRFLIPLKPQLSIWILSYEKYPSCIHTLGRWIWRFPKELKYLLSPRFFFMHKKGSIQQQIRTQIWNNCTYSMVAITFNSMAIGVGRQLISSVVRHGGFSPKYSAQRLL